MRSTNNALNWLSRYALVVFLLVLIVIFSAALPDSFPTAQNLKGILDDQTVVLIAALGVMLTLIVGEFDLSIAGNVALANILVIGLGERQGLPVPAAVALAISASVLVGLANGLIVTKLRVNAFVTTLGMATLLAGISQLYAGGTDLIEPPPGLTSLARNELAGIPLTVIYATVICIALHVALTRTVAGRRMLAVGGNPQAAVLSGIKADRYRIAAFVGDGLLAGIAGALLGARLGSAAVAGNEALLLPVFAAVLLGATVITPGRFNVLGVVIAVYFLAVTVSGLQQLGVAGWVQPAFDGAALIVAVAVSGWAARARVASARREQLRELGGSAQRASAARA